MPFSSRVHLLVSICFGSAQKTKNTSPIPTANDDNVLPSPMKGSTNVETIRTWTTTIWSSIATQRRFFIVQTFKFPSTILSTPFKDWNFPKEMTQIRVALQNKKCQNRSPPKTKYPSQVARDRTLAQDNKPWKEWRLNSHICHHTLYYHIQRLELIKKKWKKWHKLWAHWKWERRHQQSFHSPTSYQAQTCVPIYSWNTIKPSPFDGSIATHCPADCQHCFPEEIIILLQRRPIALHSRTGSIERSSKNIVSHSKYKMHVIVPLTNNNWRLEKRIMLYVLFTIMIAEPWTVRP